ncbi:acyltransferase family domain-containing protein [Phthorimaea operculella]|nr:acyltransferase family domain-containing protein [Phthorimaea operculella]
MCSKYFLLFCVIIDCVLCTTINLNWTITPAFDPEIYENALDPEECQNQLNHIRSNFLLRLQFLDAGLKFPRGITELNFLDLGMYDQCLDINEDINTSVIEGKYCLIQWPADSTFAEVAQRMNWHEFDLSLLSEENLNAYRKIEEAKKRVEALVTGVDQPRTIIGGGDLAELLKFRMALCVPKVCTAQEGLSGLLFNFTRIGFNYDVEFCRFKDDKPWVAADYVAIVIFSIIGFLTVLSTGYDVYYTFFQNDPKQKSADIYKTFSIYTNSRRLTTFTHNPNNLNCLDGIRAISMFWIVVGHAFLLMPPIVNQRYVLLEWIYSLKSTWLTAAPYTVDTFLLLAGLLLVYTSVGKMSGINFLKSLHLFYLNRLLRVFPLLATLVLLQASLLFRIADGPLWQFNTSNTENCRKYWWATLLYIQNYFNIDEQCLLHSWYLAIDIQCYVLSPIVLYWCLSKKKMHAWIGLAFGVIATVTICTTYSFIMKFPGWNLGVVREGGSEEYQTKYYYNTVARAPPFFIGMVFGYLLNTWKGKQPVIPRAFNVFMWLFSGALMLVLIYMTYLLKQPDWDTFIIDDLHNSFGRSAWCLALGWIIFACQTGYGGPINWFLCLDIWKLPSRISYAIYLFHYHMQFVINGMARQPVFFRDVLAMYYFFAQVLMSYGIAFVMTLLIDAPCSTLVKLALGGGPKKPAAQKE